MPLVVVAGFAVGGPVVFETLRPGPAMAQCGAACAAAKCNPCAAGNESPCNPCAAAKCNPCAAGPTAAAASACAVPRLQTAASNPCAVSKETPCSPCAAAGNPCNPCNPCGAGGGGAALSDEEAVALYDCLLQELKAAYAKSDQPVAAAYQSWTRYSTRPYVSATHGERHVQNYGNAAARAYGAYEGAGEMPEGAILAKDSFTIGSDGHAAPGPLFVMEKMAERWNAASADWRYTMIMPNGGVFGVTKGIGGEKMQFCADCHMTVAPDVDSLMFLPEEYRVTR